MHRESSESLINNVGLKRLITNRAGYDFFSFTGWPPCLACAHEPALFGF